MIHPTAKVSEKVNRKCRLGTWFYNFQPTTPTLSAQILRRHWCHLLNTLNIFCEQANCQNFLVWLSHLQHAARLFQTAPYDWLSLSYSWGSFVFSDTNFWAAQWRETQLCQFSDFCRQLQHSWGFCCHCIVRCIVLIIYILRNRPMYYLLNADYRGNTIAVNWSQIFSIF